MTLETIHIYSQGIVREQQVHTDIADQVISRLQREGYTCWRVIKNTELNNLQLNKPAI
jgi:predicted rRNA methylase YqxC with S4 and FtsJ domains